MKAWKSFLLIMLSVCLSVGMCGAWEPACAQEKPMYVALGDSIATGYGLDGYLTKPGPYAKDSFVNIFAAECGFTPVNMAVDGRASSGLSKSLSKPSDQTVTAISRAEIITISVGGNDLLNAFYNKIGTALGIDVTKSGYKTEIKKEIATGIIKNDTVVRDAISKAAWEFSLGLDALATAFEKNLRTSINAVKAINGDCVILLLTVPNPYNSMSLSPELDEAFDKAVRRVNRVIMDEEGECGYTAVDIYTAFADSAKAAPETALFHAPLNPHPNKAGHKLIANETKKAYEQQLQDIQTYMWRYHLYAVHTFMPLTM